MRLPKRGEKGFTLIELLIVVAILGVLAAVVIPNVGRFIGRGEEEAKDTELSNMQSAVVAMMVDNGLSTLPHPEDTTRTNDMTAFPDDTSACATANEKVSDPGGTLYVSGSDKNGFILYGHDIKAGDAQAELVNYTAANTTAYWYTVDKAGTVTQYDTAP